MARISNPNMTRVLVAEMLFQCGVLALKQKKLQVRAAWLTDTADFVAEYDAFPVSLIVFSEMVDFQTTPEGFDVCHILDEQETVLINRYPDSLTVDKLADCIAASGIAVFEWALRTGNAKEL